MSKVALITGITGQDGGIGANATLQGHNIGLRVAFIDEAILIICSILGRKASIEGDEELFRPNNTPCNLKNRNWLGKRWIF